jgi:hypothetical protein
MVKNLGVEGAYGIFSISLRRVCKIGVEAMTPTGKE